MEDLDMRGHIQRRTSRNGVHYSVVLDLPRGADGKRRLKRVGACPTKKEAEALLARRLAAGVHPSTDRNWHTRFSTALRKAVRQQLLHANPAAAGVVDAPRVKV